MRNSKGQFVKGFVPPTAIKKGEHRGVKTQFKKGHKTWNKGKPYLKIKGDKHWHWRGGITPWRKKMWCSSEHKYWRKAIFTRDNFICQKCGESGGYLMAHHINNFADFPELRVAIDNGITLCRECHAIFHKLYGCKNNTKEQLKEFLTI